MDLSSRDGRRLQGGRIKEAARDAGLTLDEVARRIGCSRALIYQYASGASLAQTDRLQQIAAEVSKPLAWFFEDDTSSATASQTGQPTDVVAELAAERDRITAEWARLEQRLADADISRLEALLTAYSQPPDPRRVIDCCQQLYPLLARAEDTRRLAAILFQQGNALIKIQEWGSAKEKLEEAGARYRAANEPVLARDCLQSLGHVNLMLGRANEALSQFEDVAAGEDWANRWQGTLSVGACHEMLGNYAEAIAAFERAIEIADERENAPETAVARLYIEANWANLELNFGDFAGALRRAERCLRTTLQLGIQDQYIEALLTSGAALLHLGDLAAAARNFQQARDAAGLIGDQQHISLGLAYQSLCAAVTHHGAAAVTCGKEALALALRCGAVRAEIAAQRSLAEAYLASGNAGEALYHARQGALVAANMRVKFSLAQFGVISARSHLFDRRYAEAKVEANRALALATELTARPIQFEAMLTAAESVLAAGDAAAAEDLARSAAAIADSLGTTDTRWRSIALCALCAARLGRTADARIDFDRAVTLIGEIRDRLRKSLDEDTFLEDPFAQEILRAWLDFVAKNDGSDRAIEAAARLEWPPFAEWIEQRIAEHGDKAQS